MVLLIDANIILDVLLNRPDYVKDSAMIWKLCETEQIEDVFHKLNLIFEFADFSVSDLTHAADLNWNDFEDAVQSVTAERIHADYIITRNVRDFSKSRVMAFTPPELLARI